MKDILVTIGAWMVVALLVLGATLGIAFAIFGWTTVPAGHVGIYDELGNVNDKEYSTGFHWKVPWSGIHSMSIQTKEIKETSEVPSKEGLIVTLDVSIWYKVKPDRASDIYRTIGENYQDVVINPLLRSSIRDITSKYEVKTLYTDGREIVSTEIFELMKDELDSRGIELETVMLRDLKLPLTVANAIEQKLKAEQEAEQMEFVLEKETQEAERKRIEAQGIADSQAIIDQSLTPEYLRWYWLTHLKDHTSVIYVPIEPDGMIDMGNYVPK